MASVTMKGSRPGSPSAGRNTPPSSQRLEWETAFQRSANSGTNMVVPRLGTANSPRSDRPLEMPLLGDSMPVSPMPAAKTAPGELPTGAAAESQLQSIIKALLYGVINMIVVTPVMIGFAAIIFRHHSFHRDPATYAQLVKLVLFSSAVHQTAFTSFSSLPFAIGQVQARERTPSRAAPTAAASVRRRGYFRAILFFFRAR